MQLPTRELIRQALLTELAESPFQQITVKQVCDRAGVSRQALYNHYFSLMDLLHAICQDALQDCLMKSGPGTSGRRGSALPSANSGTTAPCTSMCSTRPTVWSS